MILSKHYYPVKAVIKIEYTIMSISYKFKNIQVQKKKELLLRVIPFLLQLEI